MPFPLSDTFGALEHVTGDATLILPSRDISPATLARLNDITRRVAGALDITGPFNMQVIWKGDDLKVIECNLRASRRYRS